MTSLEPPSLERRLVLAQDPDPAVASAAARNLNPSDGRAFDLLLRLALDERPAVVEAAVWALSMADPVAQPAAVDVLGLALARRPDAVRHVPPGGTAGLAALPRVFGTAPTSVVLTCAVCGDGFGRYTVHPPGSAPQDKWAWSTAGEDPVATAAAGVPGLLVGRPATAAAQDGAPQWQRQFERAVCLRDDLAWCTRHRTETVDRIPLPKDEWHWRDGEDPGDRVVVRVRYPCGHEREAHP